VDFHIDKDVRGIRVAPLLFICFVENAFKYVGSNRQEQSRVNISFAKSSNELRFKCLNTKDPIPVQNIEHKGIGISNARRRLALHYPENHSLTIQENDEYYLVKLSIQLDEVEMHNS
jgi:LytS/YehU family sensor histidine kinase